MSETAGTSPDLAQERARLIEHVRNFPYFKLMGFELIEAEPYQAKMTMVWRPDLTQPAGIMHGGVIASLVDTTIAHSMQLTPEFFRARDNGAVMVSVDLRIKYLRPVSAGRIYCEARLPRVGRQITHATAIVTNDDGKEVASGDSIYMLVPGEQIRKKD